MSIIVTTCTSSIPFTTNANYLQKNDLIGLYAAAMVAQGFVIANDTVGSSSVPRVLTISHPNSLHNFILDSSTASYQPVEILLKALDGVTTLLTKQFTVSGTMTELQGGTIRILTGPTALIVLFTGTAGATCCFGLLKFSNGEWRIWGPFLGINNNAGIMENLTNTIYQTLASPFYVISDSGAFAMIPWGVQVSGSSNIWDPYPLAAFSMNPSGFTNQNFYTDGVKNYFHYGNLMISD